MLYMLYLCYVYYGTNFQDILTLGKINEDLFSYILLFIYLFEFSVFEFTVNSTVFFSFLAVFILYFIFDVVVSFVVMTLSTFISAKVSKIQQQQQQ